MKAPLSLSRDTAPLLSLREIRARQRAERRSDLCQMAADWIGGVILTLLGVLIIYLVMAL